MLHFLGMFLYKAALILATPLLLVLGTIITWKVMIWLLKRAFNKFDKWLDTEL